MLHFDDVNVRKHLLSCEFGLEKEGLRVTSDGFFAHTRHPFDENEKNIIRDFCENQSEINTGVSDSAKGAIDELSRHLNRLTRRLVSQDEPEYLWPFSSPPYIRNEEDIPVALFEGVLGSKTAYRHYLSDKYGRYKMTFSGIHVNFSFPAKLLEADYKLTDGMTYSEYKNKLYLSLASGLIEYGWILVALTAASPLLDSSYLDHGNYGHTDITDMASVRCSEMGYWNEFIPVLNYKSISDYAQSIRDYVDKGLLKTPSELYYPIRLKSIGENDLDRLIEGGVSHIELRMFDLNPLTDVGVELKDIMFAGYLMAYIASTYDADKSPLDSKDQHRAVENFKQAAHFDIDHETITLSDGSIVPIAKAGINVINQMREVLPDSVSEVLDFEESKLMDKKKRYAYILRDKYGDNFVKDVMRDIISKKS